MARGHLPLTLHDVFAQYGIHRPIDLAKRVGLSRQYAHVLWTGQTPISRRMAARIAAATPIPYVALLTAETPTPQTPPPPSRRRRQAVTP